MQNELPLLINSPPTIHRQKSKEPKKSQTHNIWLNDSPDLYPIVFKENTGLKIYPNGDKPIDFFDLLVTDDFYDFVLEETNNYAAELYLTRSSNKSRISKWIELKAFFGLVFLQAR